MVVYSQRRLLWLVIGVSVVLRLASAAYQGNEIRPMPGVTDQISYHELAIRVAHGHGFSFATGWWPATRANEPTAHWSYLYVLFVAGIYSIFGTNPLAVRIVQAVLAGVLQPWLVSRIGTRLFGHRVGLVSAALTAVYGYFVFYAGALVTESLYFIAVLWVVDSALGLAGEGRPRLALSGWSGFGLACAAAVLLRQAFALLIPVLLVWLVWRAAAAVRFRTLAARLGVACGIIALCIAPWTFRNYKAFGSFVLLNTNAGFVFFWANHPVHGTAFIPIIPSNGPVNYGTLLPPELSSLNEAQLDRELFRRALGFVRDDPSRYFRLSVSRISEFFKFWPSPGSSRLSNVVRVLSFGLLAPLLAAGCGVAVRAWRRKWDDRARGQLLLMVLAGIYSLAHVLTWTLVRYRLPVDAITIPFAAFAIVQLGSWLRSSASLPPLRFVQDGR